MEGGHYDNCVEDKDIGKILSNIRSQLIFDAPFTFIIEWEKAKTCKELLL